MDFPVIVGIAALGLFVVNAASRSRADSGRSRADSGKEEDNGTVPPLDGGSATTDPLGGGNGEEPPIDYTEIPSGVIPPPPRQKS